MVDRLLLDADIEPLFVDRRDAGQELGKAVERRCAESPVVVVGLARGGVPVAAEVADMLRAPLDVVAVRKLGHPAQPEYALGAVAPGDGVYLRDNGGLSEAQIAELVARTKAAASALDARLHVHDAPLDLADRTVVMVDDGLATGATMIAALRWARARRASSVIAAVPVAPAESVVLVAGEADDVVCPHVPDAFIAVGLWYWSFVQLTDEDVVDLLEQSRRARIATP